MRSQHFVRYLWLLGLLAQAAVAEPAAPLILENHLAQCLEVRELGRSRQANLLLLEVELQAQPSTAECGCKSALITYTSYRRFAGPDADEARDVLQSGQIGTDKGRYLLPLASYPSALQNGAPVYLSLDCAASI